jgi:hypothetical protein
MGDFDLPGLSAGMGTSGILGLGMGGLNGPMTAGGNDIFSFQVIDPPDDRYIAGSHTVQVDGDSRTIGPRLKDLNIPFSLYGLPIPITFGVRKLYSNIIWAVPLRENIKKNSSTGKGGSAVGVTSSTTEYEYYATYAVAFGYPGLPDVGNRKIIRVWADGTLIYNRRGTGQQKIAGFNFRFYDGSEEQLPDPLMEERDGVGNVPGYRGLMYMVIDDLPVKAWGDRPPAISVEIGDDTAGTYSITNIGGGEFPVGSGSVAMDWVLVDDSLNQAVTIRDSTTAGWPLRTFDFNSNTRLSSVHANPYPGVGWVGNVQNLNTATMAHRVGMKVQTSQFWTYIPWLGLIAGQADYSAAGSSPLILVDPISGLVRHWIGSTDEGPNLEYPLLDEFLLAGYDLEKQFYPASVPHLEQLVAQIAYTAFGANTFIAGRTIYGDTVFFKLDGITGILDMVHIDLNSYNSICPGGVYPASSEYFAVNGNIIYKYIITPAARRVFVGPGSYSEGITRELYKDMGAGVNNIYYYRAEDALIVFMDSGTVKKLDARDAATEIWSVDDVTPLPTAHGENFHLNDSDGGFLSWGNGTVNELDLTFGTYATYPIGSIDYFVKNRAHVNSVNKSITGIGTGGLGGEGPDQIASKDNAVSRYFYDRIDDVRILLADFIRGVCIWAGYEDADIIIDAEIDDEIDGAIVVGGTTFKRIMDVVLLLYRIDIIESGGQIKFKRKAVGYTGSDFTVDEGGTLLPTLTNPSDPTFNFRREEEVVMPRRVNVRYIDKNLDYQWAVMSGTRADVTNESTNEATYEVPIVMTASEAKTLANRVLYYFWNARNSFQFRLPPRHLKIEPGDVGLVTSMGLAFNIKAVEVTYNNDYSIGIRATSFLADTAVVIEGYSGTGYPQVITPIQGAQVFIIDTPLIRPGDDLNYSGAFPLYVQVSPLVLTSAWPGGSGMYSEGGITYSSLASNIVEGLVLTVVSEPVVPDSVLQMDLVNDLTVVCRAGDAAQLASATLDELNAGANLAAYGANGRWELIQFMDVTDNGNNSFTLHGIRRARRGTDYAVDFHRVGDTMVLLSTDWTSIASFTHDQTELSFSFKGVGFGQNAAAVIPYRTTLHGYGALPWVPTVPEIQRSIAAGTGDLEVRWKRRDRVTGVMADGGETVNLRNTEENIYKITVYRNPHYEWHFDGFLWQFTISEAEYYEFETAEYPYEYDVLTGEIIDDGWLRFDITHAMIRTAQLYEHMVPSNFSDPDALFVTPQSANVIDSNAEANAVIASLGYDEWSAFKYLDVMIQQKTNVPNSTGWGPGRRVRVRIKDL